MNLSFRFVILLDSVVPWYSPMLATGKLLVMAATGKIKYLQTTNFFQRFQTVLNPPASFMIIF